MTTQHWSATENRLIEPYLRADGLLHRVKFRCEPSNEFSEGGVTWFDRTSVPCPFLAEFSFDFDAARLAAAVDIPVGDLAAHVIVRDRAVKHWQRVASWPVVGVPDTYVVSIDDRVFAPGRRMEFVFMIAPATALPRRAERAFRTDQVVAEIAFETNVRKGGTRFNVATMPPEWFESHGMPRDAVWAIDWEDHDPMVEPITALNVVVNERYAETLQQVFGSDANADALASQIAVEVFVEAAYMALRNANGYEPEPSTLLGSVITGLGIGTSEDFDALKVRTADDFGRVSALSFIRARAQSSVGLARALRSRSGGNG